MMKNTRNLEVQFLFVKKFKSPLLIDNLIVANIIPFDTKPLHSYSHSISNHLEKSFKDYFSALRIYSLKSFIERF